MPEVRLVLYPNELDRLLRSPGGPVGRHIVKLAKETAAEAERRARAGSEPRVLTGRYAANFRVETDFTGPNGFTVRVRNATTGQNPRRRTSYAGVIETGSQAHPIRPRDSNGYLRFKVKGRWVTVKAVAHPGTKPRNILREALRTTILRHGGR